MLKARKFHSLIYKKKKIYEKYKNFWFRLGARKAIRYLQYILISFWLGEMRDLGLSRYTFMTDTNFANWKPLQMTKNVFHFILKAFLYSRYLNFCLDILTMHKNSFIRKIWLISKLMTSKPGKQTINIFPNISRSNDIQTIEFCETIE